MTKSIGISDFAVLFSAMSTVAWIIIGASRAIVQSFENGLYISNLRTFLEYEPVIDEKQDGEYPAVLQKPGEEEIAFRDVSFTYREQKEPTLKNINIAIGHGEKIAIVGPNGAGKTTFIKFLMRLYDASEGKVLYHGVNVKELNLPEYRKLYGTAFQDYQVFSLTIAENVLMKKPSGEADYKKAKEALIRDGVYDKILTLPKGMDTVLTREFDQDGAVLSGGELQKIAVARADRIFLFEDGRIAEQGSHEELMRLDGKYAEMFRLQAEKYNHGLYPLDTARAFDHNKLSDEEKKIRITENFGSDAA